MTDPTRSYYQAALAGLRFVESRQPSQRRFGDNARALWSEFRGDLTDADRIDLMLRDADVQWPGAFGAQTVFEAEGVAEDDAFGPEWEGLDAVDSAELLREVERTPAAADAVGALSAAASAWGLTLSPMDAPAVGASDHFVVVGPSAVTAMMRAFADSCDLDWVDQVTCVASSPTHRQIAALAGGLLSISKRARIFTSQRLMPMKPGSKLVTSPDADAADVAVAQKLVEGK